MSCATETTLPFPGGTADLLRVFESARRFVTCRARAAALATCNESAGTLAEAIERDFLAFDLSRAERELCEAVTAIAPEPLCTEGATARDA